MKWTLSTLLITFFLIDSVLLSLNLAASQMQDVGGDFGESWLVKFSNKFAVSDTAASSNATAGARDLWSWGSRPRGYEVIGGRLMPVIAQPEHYYPLFMTNTTPIVINGTTNTYRSNYLPLDFMSPEFAVDPWFLAQITDRPVVVVYPANTRGSTLL